MWDFEFDDRWSVRLSLAFFVRAGGEEMKSVRDLLMRKLGCRDERSSVKDADGLLPMDDDDMVNEE